MSVIAQSHIPFHNTAIKVLLDRGHTVDLVIAQLNEMVKLKFPNGVGKNYTFGYEDPNFYRKNAGHLSDIFVEKPIPMAEFLTFDDMTFNLCETVVKDPNLLNYIKQGNYDIGLSSDYDPCANILMHAGGVPSKASMVPTPLFQPQIVSAGLPSPASVYGTVLYPKGDDSFFNRLFHLIRHTYNIYFVAPRLMEKYNNLLLETFGPTFPSAEEIERNVDIILVNSNEIIEKPRPVSHKIKYIGGMGKKKAQPLNKEFNDILATSNKGVVLFSFGTQVATSKVPIEIRKNFVTAFKHFPDFSFLWKYDNLTDDAELFADSSNIHRVEWLPQTDLLGDNRVKAFISHMGLNSFLETSAAGIPVLAVPLFIDQQHNALNAVSRDIGVIVERHQLTVENLVNALQKLLYNPKYGENAKMISKMMNEKPEQSERLFVDWVEYAAKNPGLHKIMNLPGAELTPFWYYSVDVILIVVLSLTSSLIIIWKTLSFIKCQISIRSVRSIEPKSKSE